MKSLINCHTALAASRKTDEMQTIIRKQGGTSEVRSLQGTVFLAELDVAEEFQATIMKKPDVFVFTTGIGTETLFRLAEKEKFDKQLYEALQGATIAARGYKTHAVLKKYGFVPDLRDEDGTTAGLIEVMRDLDLNDKLVMVQLHGMDAPLLRTFLETNGAISKEILPYQHVSVKEEDVLLLLDELESGCYDAICFTTGIQARELFKVAIKHHKKENLLKLFENNVVAVSVGKVTSEELSNQGVKRIVAPQIERMGAMIMELGNYMKESKG
ncbi:uroporphyrinogen-III synthase [Alkalicoccobacillus plakortidis]|uniref:Uroporphyrinogen-III synthase n=1 Tax=Alkalicoccobacillus plakortidis TaxID=444060 RepID=A0ABT0XF73_9BACI|nr:uroporphyrinogen-III synthase [Alkalicoccobacillus plakortidis]MCM2674537.1 uroporphyrinogen-III synthase [Alkalicoccobacillus plakortidis]